MTWVLRMFFQRFPGHGDDGDRGDGRGGDVGMGYLLVIGLAVVIAAGPVVIWRGDLHLPVLVLRNCVRVVD